MSTTNIDIRSPDFAPGPFCQACGGPTRLAGIESHPRLPRTDIRTFECTACQDMQAVVVPLPSASVNAIVVVGGAA
jgi:hypothetical protein